MGLRTAYGWPGFALTTDGDTGEVITTYENGRWSGCGPVPEDGHHAKALGTTPAQHRLAHELAHHLIGTSVLGQPSSPIIWRDAHHVPQPDPDPDHEEWLVTALTYLAYGKPPSWGALLDISHHADPLHLARLLRWLMDAPSGATVVLP